MFWGLATPTFQRAAAGASKFPHTMSFLRPLFGVFTIVIKLHVSTRSIKGNDNDDHDDDDDTQQLRVCRSGCVGQQVNLFASTPAHKMCLSSTNLVVSGIYRATTRGYT